MKGNFIAPKYALFGVQYKSYKGIESFVGRLLKNIRRV
jgi:hypothetical protein